MSTIGKSPLCYIPPMIAIGAYLIPESFQPCDFCL